MMDARAEGQTRRPSVETLLHDLFPQQYVLHVHPASVNGITCSREGEKAMKRLFPGAIWVDACKPGYILALACKEKMDDYKAQTGADCNLLFLQNHGIFFASDTVEELDALAETTMQTIDTQIKAQPDSTPVGVDVQKVGFFSKQLEALFGAGKPAAVTFTASKAVLDYDPTTKSVSPDHIVYAKAKQLILSVQANEQEIADAFAAFTAQNGYQPKIVFVAGLGMFSCGLTEKEANVSREVMLDAIKVVFYTQYFGGVSTMPEELIDFIINWEVESYRAKVSAGN